MEQKRAATLVARAWGGFAVASLALLFAGMFALMLSLVQFFKLSDTQQILLQTFAFHWVGLIFIVGHAKSLKTSWAVLYGMGGNLFRRIGQVLYHYAGMMAVVIVGALGWDPLMKFFGVEVEPQDVVTIILNAEPLALKVYLIFLAVVLAPVFEELLFRGVLFPVLAKRMPIKTAAVLVSLGFALLHAHLPAFLPLVLVSLCLCYAYWRTGSLWVNIGMHMLFNGINLLVMFQFAGG
ncbi:lysostaphin resistance A-like protein [Verrucomicrobiota bacterium]